MLLLTAFPHLKSIATEQCAWDKSLKSLSTLKTVKDGYTATCETLHCLGVSSPPLIMTTGCNALCYFRVV